MSPKATLTVGMLVFRKNFSEVLLTKHKETAKHQTGTYGIPAGRVEVGETETEALLREFKHETGLSSSAGDAVELPFKYCAMIERKGSSPDYLS